MTPKPGRTNLSLETQTTWWVQTVYLCSLTTSEEGNSWSVTECDKQGTSLAPAVLPAPWRGAQSSMKYELDTLTLFTVPKNLKNRKKKTKKEERNKHIHKESRRSPASPRLYSCSFLSFYLFFFRCFQGLQKIKIKRSYLNKGTEVGMHDQCTD